jgi:hypothetical protein
MTGWIAIHRKLTENPIWLCETFTRGQAWIDLIILANHDDGYIVVRGNRIEINRGQVGWSVDRLCKRWRWSRGKVNRFLNELKTDRQIDRQNNSISSIITILNYDTYQNGGHKTVHQTVQQTVQQTVHQTVHQTDARRYTNNNVNKETNKSGFFSFFSDKYGIEKDAIFRDGTNLIEKKIFVWHIFESLSYDKSICSKYFDKIHERNFCDNKGDPYTVNMLVSEILYYHKRGWLKGDMDEQDTV